MPWEHAARPLPADYERFAPLMAGAIRRFPFLADAEVVRLVCHPDAMTPDANPLIGPLPGVRGFWVAAGLSLNGFGGGGGIGRAHRGLDHGRRSGRRHRAVSGVAVRRHVSRPDIRGRAWSRDLLRLLPPSLPVRRGPGGPPASAVGAPRPAPGGGRRLRHEGRLGAGGPSRAGSRRGDGRVGTRPPTAGRSRPGSSGSWPRAGQSASGSASSTSPRSARSPSRDRARCRSSSASPRTTSTGRSAASIYTQFCDERGGMVADVTVTRLAETAFRVVTGAGLPRRRPGLAADPIDSTTSTPSIRDVSGRPGDDRPVGTARARHPGCGDRGCGR